MSFTALIGRSASGFSAFLLLMAVVGCTGQETSLAKAGTASTAGLELGSGDSGGSVGTEVEENLALPVLVPAFGLEGSSTECKFSDDPYSTCI